MEYNVNFAKPLHNMRIQKQARLAMPPSHLYLFMRTLVLFLLLLETLG